MKENNEVIVNNSTNKSNKPMGFKICLGSIIAILVIALVLITTFFTLLFSVNQVNEAKANSIMTNVTLAVMPKSIKSVDGSNLTFYVEKNDNFNSETDQPMEIFNFYYLDENGEKQYLEDGVYIKESGEDMNVALGFLASTSAKIESIKRIAVTMSVFALIALFGLGIWLSYYFWAEHEEKKEAKGYKNKVKAKSKK